MIQDGKERKVELHPHIMYEFATMLPREGEIDVLIASPMESI